MSEAIWVTLQLATVTVILLLLIGTPLAWWLSGTRSRFKAPVEAITAIPLVLPPTVLGFYLLILMGEHGLLGQFWRVLFDHPLSFTFAGLVVASCIYSLPFVVQPLQAAFEQLDRNAIEAAWTLGASRRRPERGRPRHPPRTTQLPAAQTAGQTQRGEVTSPRHDESF